MKRQNILVTGAAGFIGSHAAQALIERGYRVIGVDNFCDFYDRSWKEMNLKSIGATCRALEVEEARAPDPISPSAATSRAAELLCYTSCHLYKLPGFGLRFSPVFGPRQRPDLAIHTSTRLISAGQPVPVFGDGSTSRDYTYVD